MFRASANNGERRHVVEYSYYLIVSPDLRSYSSNGLRRDAGVSSADFTVAGSLDVRPLVPGKHPECPVVNETLTA